MDCDLDVMLRDPQAFERVLGWVRTQVLYAHKNRQPNPFHRVGSAVGVASSMLQPLPTQDAEDE